MKAEEIFIRWAWLIDHVRSNPGISRLQIFYDWDKSSFSQNGQSKFCRATFCNDIESLYQKLGIRFKTTRSHTDGYVLEFDNSLFDFKIRKWLLNCFHYKAKIERYRQLHKRIILEDFESENQFLDSIAEAMDSFKKIQISYQEYGSTITQDIVEPYCVKAFKRGFFLLGKNISKGFLMYHFEDIISIEVTKESFEMDESFEASEFFKYYYGAYLNYSGDNPERVIIRAWEDQKRHIRKAPIHHTQREIYSCEAYADFEVTLYPTNDFLSDILQQAGHLEIISPLSVRQELSRSISLMASRYQD